MLLQPFVENALIHGISRIEHKGKVEINFDLEGDVLHCCIVDNGIGRTKSEALKGLSPKKHQSVAIAITTERLKMITPIEGREPLRISDILNADGNIIGTKVEVWVKVAVF